ncbi:aldehyde dehydrogenase family protein [candidate division KSB1 bacterium]|nr:aldehyde dehydrogenase family protein [candidate division KSB1 bacterium]
MSEHFPQRIPGATSTAAPLEVRAPYDNELIATCDTADARAAEHALATADALFRDRSRWLPLSERLAILERAIDLLRPQAELLAVEAAREGGKPLADSRVEVTRALDSLRICVDTIRTSGGREIPMNLNAASTGRFAVTRLEPIGVVTAVSAFNHPLNLIAHQVGPALAAGCPVLIKPDPRTPLSCLRLVNIFRDAGLPAAWCQPVITADNTVAQSIVADPRVAFFSFIGSARVGWMLRSRLAPGTRCALEHGGVAPVILAADADVRAAVAPIAKGGFYHAGQVCVSVQRVFVHESVFGEFTSQLVHAAQQQKIGDPTLPETEVGPLIQERELVRVHDWVHAAVRGGARLLCGGKPVNASCYECTVLANPGPDAQISTAEIFGPVICVYAYQDLDDAIARANSLPFAFQAAVFTRSIDTALRCHARLNASAVMVNDHTAFRTDWMPFAGLRESGLGIGGIPYSIRDMQIEKLLVIKSAETRA